MIYEQPIFKGIPKKLRIVSNNICYGPCPARDDEVEQHLTINAKGRVWFSAYAFGDRTRKHIKSRSKKFGIDKPIALEILSKVSSYFAKEYIEIFATDIGNWRLEITNTAGITYKFHGSLCADLEVGGIDLSDFVRESLNMQDLYLFDGNNKPDVIEKIVLDYHRVTKITPRAIPEDVTWEYVKWDYAERLILNRDIDTIEHIQNIGTGCKVSHIYEVEGGIESILDKFDADDLFETIVGNPDDVIEDPSETKDYKITIDYKKNPQKVITGTFDKNGLPDDFEEFVDAVFDFMRFYGWGELFDPSIYGKAKRLKSDIIFCSVTFEEGDKSYYYVTEDESIKVGDFVVVPAGKDNHEAVVRVENIEYFNESNAPFPVKETKSIIRKCTVEEVDSL